MITIDICLTDLPKEKIRQANNGKKYIQLVLSERQNVGQYGETHTLAVGKTREEREAKAPTIYVGSGKEYRPAIQATPPPSQYAPPMQSASAAAEDADVDNLPF